MEERIRAICQPAKIPGKTLVFVTGRHAAKDAYEMCFGEPAPTDTRSGFVIRNRLERAGFVLRVVSATSFEKRLATIRALAPDPRESTSS